MPPKFVNFRRVSKIVDGRESLQAREFSRTCRSMAAAPCCQHKRIVEDPSAPESILMSIATVEAHGNQTVLFAPSPDINMNLSKMIESDVFVLCRHDQSGVANMREVACAFSLHAELDGNQWKNQIGGGGAIERRERSR